MRLLADMPTADLAARAAGARAIWPATGALDTVRQGALLALLRLDGSADAVWRLTEHLGAAADRICCARRPTAPEGPATDSLRAAVLPWLRDAPRPAPRWPRRSRR